MQSLKGKRILITGGTGSLGQALTRKLLKDGVDVIRIFSRNENKQVMMEQEFHDDRLRFLVGDIRDLSRLERALEGIDIVFHAAALKHVPVVEYNPFEAIKTNVFGSQNVIDACLHEDVEVSVAIGTDKAVSPLNTYGATKLLMEKLFVTASNYLDKKRHPTKFLALRYGNVLGSSGSVIPKFIQQIKSNKKITITSPEMTRFSITMDEALEFITSSVIMAKGSEVFVPKIRAYKIETLIKSMSEIFGNIKTEDINVRQGEKFHETLINEDELKYTIETKSRYVILRDFAEQVKKGTYKDMVKNSLSNRYSSELVEQISSSELTRLIKKSGLIN